MEGWDLEAITAKWQKAWWKQGIQHADRPKNAKVPWWEDSAPGRSPAPGGPKAPHSEATSAETAAAVSPKPTYFVHFAYPGISGYLHVGHMRGFTYTDVFARYKRMTGHDVLFPAGFHASGIPAVAFAAEVKRGEKTEYLKQNGYEGMIKDLEDPRRVIDYFAHVYTDEYWRPFGFLIDERRNCTTIDDGYQRFIQWQFRRLKQKGYLIEKPHYAPFCPVQGPVAVDKSETDIKQGGGAEILEYVAMKFVLPAGVIHEEPVIIPCATLRPETVYGCTNVWIHPEAEYQLVRVWEDGAVKDSDKSELWLVSDAGKRKLEWQFERAKDLPGNVRTRELLGEIVTAPLTGKHVPIIGGTFVDPDIATGLVMSVPGHAPFDYAAYVDAGLLKTLGEPPQIVTIEGAPSGLPARLACQKHGVKSQADRVKLEAATVEVYGDEFNKGVLTKECGPYAGQRIKGVKDKLKADLVAGHQARILRQFSEMVISRSGEVVDIKRIPDQDFIHYADKAWTEQAKAHAATMTILPQRYKEEMPHVLDWFGDRACVRRGAWLGTEFPFKPGWIIEPIADSTFYPWFYVVQRYLKSSWNPTPAAGGLKPDELTDEFFDYVINGKGKPQKPAWDEVRKDLLYYGPVDINLGGKEHQTVHFPVYVMNMVALLDDPKLRPRGIFVNWWVTQKAGAKISKSKGGAEPIPGAAKKYGVDPMRLYYCHVGSPHVDIEWDPDVVGDYRKHVERIMRTTDEALAAKGTAGPMDAWLEAAFAGAMAGGRDAYERYDLRAAANELVYNVPELFRWYARRGGHNGTLLKQIIQEWAKALCPMAPHLAEEMFERAGAKGLCSVAEFPSPKKVDQVALASEEFLRAVLDDIHTVRKLANVEKPKALTLYTTPAWKRQLLARAVELHKASGGKFPMGALMSEVMADTEMRARGKDVQNFAGKLPAMVTQLSPRQRELLASTTGEDQILGASAPFLAEEFGVKHVDVFAADDQKAPDHPKRNVAAPFKPGIALV